MADSLPALQPRTSSRVRIHEEVVPPIIQPSSSSPPSSAAATSRRLRRQASSTPPQASGSSSSSHNKKPSTAAALSASLSSPWPRSPAAPSALGNGDMNSSSHLNGSSSRAATAASRKLFTTGASSSSPSASSLPHRPQMHAASASVSQFLEFSHLKEEALRAATASSSAHPQTAGGSMSNFNAFQNNFQLDHLVPLPLLSPDAPPLPNSDNMDDFPLPPASRPESSLGFDIERIFSAIPASSAASASSSDLFSHTAIPENNHDESVRWHTSKFPTPKPLGRQDASKLSTWMDQSTAEISKLQTVDPVNYLRQMQAVYGAVVHDIVRQISVECVERGRLLAKVWVRYAQLFSHLLRNLDKESTRFKARETKLQDDLEAIRSNYMRDIGKMNQAMRKSGETIEFFQKQVLTKERQLEEAKLKDQDLQRKFLSERFGGKGADRLQSLATENAALSAANDALQSKVKSLEDQVQEMSIHMSAFRAQFKGQIIARFSAEAQTEPLQISEMLQEAADHGHDLSSLFTSSDSPLHTLLQQYGLDGAGSVSGLDPGGLSSKYARDNMSLANFGLGLVRSASQTQTQTTKAYIPQSFLPLFHQRVFKNLTVVAKPREWLHRAISRINQDKTQADLLDDREGNARRSLPEFLYTHFVAIYGLRHLAERKLLELFLTCKSYADQDLRVCTFFGFLNMSGSRSNYGKGGNASEEDEDVFSLDCLNFYLYTVSVLRAKAASLPMSEEMDNRWVSLQAAQEAIRSVFKFCTASELSTLLEHVGDLQTRSAAAAKKPKFNNQSNSEHPPPPENSIDLDQFLLFVLAEWRKFADTLPALLQELYTAADRRSNGTLTITEMRSLLKHLGASPKFLTDVGPGLALEAEEITRRDLQFQEEEKMAEQALFQSQDVRGHQVKKSLFPTPLSASSASSTPADAPAVDDDDFLTRERPPITSASALLHKANPKLASSAISSPPETLRRSASSLAMQRSPSSVRLSNGGPGSPHIQASNSSTSGVLSEIKQRIISSTCFADVVLNSFILAQPMHQMERIVRTLRSLNPEHIKLQLEFEEQQSLFQQNVAAKTIQKAWRAFRVRHLSRFAARRKKKEHKERKRLRQQGLLQDDGGSSSDEDDSSEDGSDVDEEEEDNRRHGKHRMKRKQSLRKVAGNSTPARAQTLYRDVDTITLIQEKEEREAENERITLMALLEEQRSAMGVSSGGADDDENE